VSYVIGLAGLYVTYNLIFGLTTVPPVGISPVTTKGPFLTAATWNVAAINNNPFEYWITYDDPAYDSLMQKVSDFIQKPGSKDISVKEVFTEEMFQDLKAKMLESNWNQKENAVTMTEKAWNQNFKNRKIISGFIQDGLLGKKRLASMPDRVTNTINLADGTIAYRPTVINCYPGP